MASERWPETDDEAARLIRSHDWTATRLGPIEAWPQPLKRAVELVLALPMPATVLWGAERLALPNAAFLALGGDGISLALGAPLRGWRAPGHGAVDAVFRGTAAHGARGWGLAPLREPNGEVAGVLALPQHEGDGEAIAQLQHSARNAIARVRTIAKRTAATSPDLDDYVMHLDGRIDSVSRVRAATELDPHGVDLTELVAAEMLAAAAHEDELVTIAGPDVRLIPRAADVIALAIHELATNAIKFGALGVPGGRVEVRWSLDAGRLALEWTERGVPGPLSIERSGFGLEVLERMLPYELDALTTFRLAEGGVHCLISVPLTQARAEPQPSASVRSVYDTGLGQRGTSS